MNEYAKQECTVDPQRVLLQGGQQIAVVGLSDNPQRISFQVANYLQQAGFSIIPVNPTISSALGVDAVDSLHDISAQIDIVNVFRRPEHTPPIARQAVEVGAKVLWLQQGITNDEAFQIAKDGGLEVIMNRCIKVEHARLK